MQKSHTSPLNRLIIGISGASGAIFGIRLLELLQKTAIHTHLVITKSAHLTIESETPYRLKDIQALAHTHHPVQDVGASIASGSFATLGMIVAPCSMKSLAEIALGHSTNLLTRAADVTLKERRRLVLLTRETPLTLAHIRHMESITQMGGIIAPPVPAFYHQPASLDDIINHTTGRVLDLFHIEQHVSGRWQGLKQAG